MFPLIKIISLRLLGANHSPITDSIDQDQSTRKMLSDLELKLSDIMMNVSPSLNLKSAIFRDVTIGLKDSFKYM